MDVAELQARLVADVGSLLRGLSQADAAMENTRRLAGSAEHAVKQIKMDSKQAFETAAVAGAINQEIERVGRTALRTADYLQDVKLRGAAAIETRLAADSEVDSLQKIERQALKTRAAMGGGKDNVFGINSIGTGRSLILAGAAAALPVLPQLAAGALGLGAAGAGGIGALIGGAAVLKLAFADITKQAFTTQKAFDKLNESQKGFVQTIRSLDAGLKTHLEHIAQAQIIPALTGGIHAAMSPGTVNAITDTVKKFSAAVAQVAQEWGKFIGGPFGQQLGQLLQNDAKYFTALSREMMHGLDVMVRFLNVAKPLVDWLSNLTSGAMKSADAWAQSAKGVAQMNKVVAVAKQGLTEVGHVLGGLFNALVALTSATSGFNTLQLLADLLNEIARIVNQNRDVLRSFFAGAAQAVNDALRAIRGLEPVLKDVLQMLQSIADLIGGWRPIIDGVIAFVVGKFILMKLGIIGVKTATTELQAALRLIAVAAGEGAAAADVALAGTAGAATAATAEVSALRLALLRLTALGPIIIPITIAEVLKHVQRSYKDFTNVSQGGGTGMSQIGNNVFQDKQGHYFQQKFIGRGADLIPISAAQAKALGAVSGGFGGARAFTQGPGGSHSGNGGRMGQNAVYQLLLSQGIPPNVAANLSTISAHGEDPSGNISALNDNPRTGDYSVGLFQENFLGQMGKNRVARYAPQFGMSGTTGVKQFVAWLGKHPGAQAKIAGDIYNSQGYGAWTTAKGLGITDAGSPFGTPPPLSQTGMHTPKIPTGLNLLPAGLANQLAKASTGTPAAAGHTWKLDAQALADLNAKLKQHNLTAKEKLAIDKEIGTITRQQESAYKVLAAASKAAMHAQVQAEKQKAAELKTAMKEALRVALEDAKEQLALAQTAFKSAFSQIASAADAAFSTGTQKALDAMQVLVDSPLGKFMFGGSITQTPAGAQLSAMQEQHTMQGLQKNLKDAQDAVANAHGSGTLFDAATGIYSSLPGDPGTMAAAQQQLADAQYAIKEHQLQKEDAIEQTAATTQLAAAKQAYQDQRRVVQDAMDQQVAAIEEGMASGAVSATTGFGRLKEIWASNGIDLGSLSFAMGGQIYTGLADGLTPIFALLKTLVADLVKVANLGGDPLPSGVPNPSDDYRNSLGLVAATHKAIPMAAGGAGRAMGPTLFYSKGGEDFAFSGEGKSFGGRGGGGVVININAGTFVGDPGEFARSIAPQIRNELLLTARRNGNSALGGLS